MDDTKPNATEPDPNKAKLIQTDANLATAGAIGTKYTPTLGASLPSVGTNTLTDVLKTAASAAIDAATEGGSSQGSADAISALAHGLTQIAESAAASFNPLAGVAAGVAGGTIEAEIGKALTIVANGVGNLYKHIGLEIPTALTAIEARFAPWLAKL